MRVHGVIGRCTVDSPQAFRFMVGPGNCSMISKYGPSLSKAVGPVDPSFLVVKISHFNKNMEVSADNRLSLAKSLLTTSCIFQYYCILSNLPESSGILNTVIENLNKY